MHFSLKHVGQSRLKTIYTVSAALFLYRKNLSFFQSACHAILLGIGLFPLHKRTAMLTDLSQNVCVYLCIINKLGLPTSLDIVYNQLFQDIVTPIS